MSLPGTFRFAACCLLSAACCLLIPRAMAQAPASNDGSVDSTPTKTQKVADLTGRYRFFERYTSDDKTIGPGMVGPYRVAIREVVRDSADSPQGAPRRTETNRLTIYAERPAEMIAATSSVTSVYRTVEKYQAALEDVSRTMGGKPLEGASVFLKPKLGELPSILGLTPGRFLTEYEFEVLCHQVFVPHLPLLLPTRIVRLGDTWLIPRKGAQALLGDTTLQGDTLVGKLTEIRKEIDGPRMVASIAISGKVNGQAGETSVNAEALFTFQMVTVPKEDAKKAATPTPTKGAGDVTEARGAFTEFRLGSEAKGPLPGPGRLRFVSSRQLTMHRQLGIAAAGVAPPSLAKPPEPDEANSWISHVDASGRYSLRHPQEMLAPDRYQPPPEPNTTLLVRTRREGRDMLQVEFAAKALTPEDLKKELAEKFKVFKTEVLKGDEVWLPEADWPGMRVHRIDADVKVGDPKAIGAAASTRVHFDGYLIQFARSSSILAIATTSKESVAPFRQEVEQILKTLQLDPARSIPN